MRHPVAGVRCPKGHWRNIHPFELPAGQLPVCEVCQLEMKGMDARDCDCPWEDPRNNGSQPPAIAELQR
jgi:hypothetical protein